jgi:hypothetical protein
MGQAEIDDRRQRAREAFSDELLTNVDNEAIDQVHHAVDAAIETATRVQITPEAVEAYIGSPGRIDVAFTAFLTALGFEVVE